VLSGVVFLLSAASHVNAAEPWMRFEPNQPDWVAAGTTPRAKFFIDQNELHIDGAVVWAFEQAVYTPGVKFFDPDKILRDSKYSGPIKKAVFLLEFLCERNTFREVNTSYWYENGETWNSGYPNLMAHGQIDIDNPIFQHMADFACAKRKGAAASTTAPTSAAPAQTEHRAAAKRASPAYAPDAIEAFYGHMAEPLTVVSVSAAGSGDFDVRYRYRKQTAICNGHAIVTTQESGGHTLIARIKPSGNC
jgi:hypothetical protein